MKKILTLILAAIMLLSLVACGEQQQQQEENKGFQIGFGKVDITPTEPIHMMSYTDPANHISEGALSPIYAMSMVMRDEDGTMMVMSFVDMGTVSNTMLNEIRPLVQERFGVDKEHMTLSCPHNHNGPDYGYSDTYDQKWKQIFNQGVLESIQLAIDDLAPAQIEIGRTETENLTFVRRYHLSNGGMTGDNYNYDHGDKIIAHESDADEEIQLVKFVRAGDKKDILIVNWQSHAAKHGHTNYISADYVGALRDKVEANLGVHCMYFQGAAGNLNPVSRIESENKVMTSGYAGAEQVGKLVAEYVVKACKDETTFTAINSGKINNKQDKFITTKTWAETNAITVGDLSFVTLPAEFFDSLGVAMKTQTPYAMTVLMGYTCGSDGCYLPDEQGFKNGGYEVNKSLFRVGDGERFVQYYLDTLNEMYKAEHS